MVLFENCSVLLFIELKDGPSRRGYFEQFDTANLQTIQPFSTAFMVGYTHLGLGI